MKKVICLLILICLLTGAAAPVCVYAHKVDLVTLPVSLDGGPVVQLTAYESNYANNYYVSLRNLAILLTGSASQFRFYNDEEGCYHVDIGLPYDPSLEPMDRPEGVDEDAEIPKEMMVKRDLTPTQSTYIENSTYWLQKNGEGAMYYTYADYSIEDLYMSLLDVQMMLDLNIVYENGVYNIITDKHFHMNLDRLNEQGYFDYLHGVLLGDATTGEIFMECKGDESVPIASTTKLMTAFIAERMIELGKITLDDPVVISANAARVSLADDSVVGMYEGEVTNVRDLMYAMMVASSNESALALAEYIAGSQEEFVKMMNAMAFKLGMDSAVFYNPHGLPEYLKGDAVVMVENHASAEDMFKLATAMMRKYPEITEFTTPDVVWLDSLWAELYATNSLMINMPDVYGLKTGTTDAAGKCLISSRTVNVNGEDHVIIAVVLGAEFNSDRFQVSELLQKGVSFYLFPETEETQSPEETENTEQGNETPAA